jgi:hypothetical protein
MITSSGANCDVCGDFILPLGNEMVNFFRVKGILEELHCHNECKELLQSIGNDWKKLPVKGRLYNAFREANEKNNL